MDTNVLELMAEDGVGAEGSRDGSRRRPVGPCGSGPAASGCRYPVVIRAAEISETSAEKTCESAFGGLERQAIVYGQSGGGDGR